MVQIEPDIPATPGYVARHITGFMWRAGLCGGGGATSWKSCASCQNTPHNVSALEEGEQGARRLEPNPSLGSDVRGLESLTFHLDVGLEVLVSCLDVGVAKPPPDHSEIDTRLKQSHGGGMPERMRGDRPPAETRNVLRRCPNGTSNNVGQPEPCQTASLRIGENGRLDTRGEPALVDQIAEDRSQVDGEWYRTLLRPFPVDEYLPRSCKRKVDAIDAERFGGACAGAQEKQHQGMVASTARGTSVGSCEESVGFWGLQESDDALDGALGADSENALRERHRGRIGEGDVPEEGMDDSQSRVARAWTVSTLAFQKIEERKYLVAIEVLDVEAIDGLVELRRDELQEKPQRILVRAQRGRARLPLACESLREERLDQRTERSATRRRHEIPPQSRVDPQRHPAIRPSR